LPGALTSRYQALLDSGEFQADEHQARAVQALDALTAELVATDGSNFLQRLMRRQARAPHGLYLWGGVGRGKTWLMDLFFEQLPLQRKQRFHFHRFMARVHDALRRHASQSDPLAAVAADWARRCQVLCFDEFHVSDIADAMLLGGLMQELFERGVTLVATSNLAPDDLYRDGLQRARFLPAIEAIKAHTRVLHLDGDTDYRLRLLARSALYHQPLNDAAGAGMAASYKSMAGEAVRSPQLRINQRTLTAIKRGDGIIWFSFDELCRQPRSTADYIEIARAFHTVLLSGVEVMDELQSDPARRFVNLVDELYDRNVKLLVSAQAPIEELYTGERLAFEFERTRSRLVEMQSHAYLARPHLP
jgi:cell division protein ZapE